MHVPVEEWSRGKRVEDRRPELHAGRGGELRAARYFGRPRECDRFRASGERAIFSRQGRLPSSSPSKLASSESRSQDYTVSSLERDSIHLHTR